MEQTRILEPKVIKSPGYPLLYNIYLHVTAWTLRTIVAYISGSGTLFDTEVFIETPGLGTGQVRCSVCLPTINIEQNSTGGIEGPLPLILVIEGGGFVLGQPSDGEHIDRMLADKLGAVVISVDYAKSPRYPFPHALLQIHHVLAWCFTPAATCKLGVALDPTRTAIMGNSAGGNLTASVSLLHALTEGPCRKFRESLPPNFRQVAQILLYPSTACNETYGSRFEKADDRMKKSSLPVWVAEMMEASYLAPGVNKQQIFVAPLLASLPLLKEIRRSITPVLCITAGLDCLNIEALEYCEKLKQAGVKVITKNFPNAIHGFTHYKEGSPKFNKEDVDGCWRLVCEVLEEVF